MRMDQEPDLGDEPLDPPTREEEEAEAWEYWHQRAHKFETALYDIAYAPEAMGKSWLMDRAKRALEARPLTSTLGTEK